MNAARIVGDLTDAPVDAIFPVQQLALDERPPELAVIRPELTKDRVDIRLRQAFSRWKGARHLGQYQAAAALPSRPLDDAAVAPEGPQLARLLGRIPVNGGHATL